MSFNFNNYEIASSEAQAYVGAIAGVLIIAAIVITLLAIVMYVIKSLGLYAIAKRRGIACAWLAWLPIGCEWITASIADQYRKVTRGKATIRRFIVLVMAVASIGLTVATTSVFQEKAEDMEELVELTDAFSEYMEDYGEYVDEDEILGFVEVMFEELSGVMDGFFLLASVSAVLAFVSKVYWYVSAGDVYASCCPKNATMMLVLSIFLPVLEPFFIFCNKEKDAGMVPVNQPQQPAQPQFVAPVEPVQPVYEAPVEPIQPVYEAPVESAQPVYEAPAELVWEAPQTPVEPWADAAPRPEPWENPEN